MALTSNSLIILARKHVAANPTYESSARACLADAVAAYDRGDYAASDMWCVKSLGYSLGVFHADYQKAKRFRDRLSHRRTFKY